MKRGTLLLIFVLLALIATFVVDHYYIAQLKEQFSELEKQRVITTNKLATAKIVHENLNHVRELVFENMDFPGQQDSISHETYFFEFITSCINDLKLKLISVKPTAPTVNGRVTVFGYDIEIEGDFFKFGEFCSKLQNSRRIISLETFDVDLISERGSSRSDNTGIKVKMRVNTYRVAKNS